MILINPKTDLCNRNSPLLALWDHGFEVGGGLGDVVFFSVGGLVGEEQTDGGSGAAKRLASCGPRLLADVQGGPELIGRFDHVVPVHWSGVEWQLFSKTITGSEEGLLEGDM